MQHEFSEMRDWQIAAFEQLQAAPFMILNAPMGSGKSWLMCLLSAFKMKNDNSLRSIIAVPQTIIASGFTKAEVQMPDGEKLRWQIKHNLCNDQHSNGIVSKLIKWLEHPSDVFVDRSILCTHATLVAAYKKLKKENRLSLLANILLWIDEAHHVKNMEIEGFENAVISNSIGEVVAYFLDNHNRKLQLGLTTASFFRGDRTTLLTSTMEQRFVRYNLSYDKYLQSMTYLKSFSFDFLVNGNNYVTAIKMIISNRNGKDIIYIPHPVSQHSTGNKLKEVENIINCYGKTSHITDDGVTIVRGARGDQKMLDLVNENQRKQKKSFLNNPILKKDHSALDGIIALGMFKEGANWIYADRSIIVGTRSSLVDVIQMVGRLFRDAKDKSHVEVIQILPFSLDQKDEEGFRENLNNYLKAIYASLILENILNPVKIKSLNKEENEQTEKSEANKVNWLNEVLPDDAQQQSLFEEVKGRLFDIMSENKETVCNIPLLYDEYNKIIPGVLSDYGITEYKEEVAKQIWATLARRTMQMTGLSVEDIDFNILQDVHPLGFLLRYTTGICDINTFEKLREAIFLSRAWLPFEEARVFVRGLKLASESEWQLYISGKMPHLTPLPNNIPRAPWAVYENKGWISMGDFLGSKQIAPSLKKYRSYEDAKNFVHALGLKSKDDWTDYTKGKLLHLSPLPKDIPASPPRTYQRSEYGNAWIGWGDFLGTGKMSNQDKSKNRMSYQEAHTFATALNLKTAKDWVRYINGEFQHLPPLPENMPRKPDQAYDEWVDWPTFLGNHEVSKFNCNREFWSFEEARNFVHKLGLKNQKEWNDYCAGKLKHLPDKPIEVPSNPAKKYKGKGWIDLKDWLGY